MWLLCYRLKLSFSLPKILYQASIKRSMRGERALYMPLIDILQNCLWLTFKGLPSFLIKMQAQRFDVLHHTEAHILNLKKLCRGRHTHIRLPSINTSSKGYKKYTLSYGRRYAGLFLKQIFLSIFFLCIITRQEHKELY